MSLWIKRLHLVFTIGGGFAGFVLSLSNIPGVIGAGFATLVLVTAFAAFYAYAIVVGIRLVEGKPSRRHLIFFYGAQLPVLSSPIFAYQLCAGAFVNVALIGTSLNLNAQLGANFNTTLLQESPWGIGMNLVAFAMLVVVARENDV